MLLGIDVSHYQGHVDWAAARAAGVAFGVAKISEGTGFVDSLGAANLARMRAAGVVPGGYHFLRAGSPAAQADHFCGLVDADMIHALDVEEPHLDVAGWVRQYRTHFPTKTLLIYTGRDLWTRAGGGNGPDYGPLWAAGYVPNAYLPGGPIAQVAAQLGVHRGGVPFAGWSTAACVQFTDHAQVPGVTGPCDADAWFGSLAQLQALAGDGKADDDMKLTDRTTLTAAQAAAMSLGTQKFTAGQTVSVDYLLKWGGPAGERAWAGIQALAAALAGVAAKVTAIETAVTSGGTISQAQLEAAAQAGAEAALAELGKILVGTPPPEVEAAELEELDRLAAIEAGADVAQ